MQLVTTGVEGLSEDAITISPRLESVSRTTRSFFGYMACRETMTYSGEAETSKKQLTRLKRDRQENPIAFWVSEDLQWDPHVQPKTSQKDARFPEESNSPSSTASRPRIGRKAQLAHQWRVFVHSAPADLGGIAMALTSVFFRRRLLLLPLFVCIAAGPVDDTWPGAHGLPPADTTEQGLLWLWRLLRPLLPLPINIAGLIWSGVLLMRRVKAKAPCGKFSMLFFFITISGPVTLAICYGISTPDDRDLAVMTSICLFFAYPFATHLGCLLVHNVRIYTVYVLALVLTCMLVLPTLERRIHDGEARRLLNVLRSPLFVLLAFLGFQMAHLCVLQNPLRDCSLRSPLRGLRGAVRQDCRPLMGSEQDDIASEDILLDDRSHA